MNKVDESFLWLLASKIREREFINVSVFNNRLLFSFDTWNLSVETSTDVSDLSANFLKTKLKIDILRTDVNCQESFILDFQTHRRYPQLHTEKIEDAFSALLKGVKSHLDNSYNFISPVNVHHFDAIGAPFWDASTLKDWGFRVSRRQTPLSDYIFTVYEEGTSGERKDLYEKLQHQFRGMLDCVKITDDGEEHLYLFAVGDDEPVVKFETNNENLVNALTDVSPSYYLQGMYVYDGISLSSFIQSYKNSVSHEQALQKVLDEKLVPRIGVR